jgi:GT2 family glycosyltransferase
VIVLSHNKLDYTRVCLDSLLATSYSPWELLVIDNGSTDGSVAWLKQFHTKAKKSGIRVELICNHANAGCSTSRNQGIAAAHGKYLAFCDNDVHLRSRHWLKKLSAILEKEPRTAMVGPKLIYPFPPFNIQCAGAAVTPSGRVQFLGRGEPKEDPQYNVAREVQCLISACFMVKKELLDRYGGFDEAFNPVEYEDIDLCYRIREQGYAIRYEPDVEMYHFESVTTEGTPALPNTYLIVKHGLLFQQRWRHLFAHENGPSDHEALWRRLPTKKLAEIGELPII